MKPPSLCSLSGHFEGGFFIFPELSNHGSPPAKPGDYLEEFINDFKLIHQLFPSHLMHSLAITHEMLTFLESFAAVRCHSQGRCIYPYQSDMDKSDTFVCKFLSLLLLLAHPTQTSSAVHTEPRQSLRRIQSDNGSRNFLYRYNLHLPGR